MYISFKNRVRIRYVFSSLGDNTYVSVVDQCSYCTPGPVSAWMGDRLRMGKPPRHRARHSRQLSLAIPSWVGDKST